MLDHPIDARDHIGQATYTVLVQHAHVVNVGIRRNARRIRPLVSTVTRSDGSYVTTVTIGVGLR